MANQTIEELADAVIELFRGDAFFDKTSATFIGYVSSALEYQHGKLRAKIDANKMPDENHPYWRQFFTESTISLAADTTDYATPATEAIRFDIFHSLVDATTLDPLTKFDLKDERLIRTSAMLGARSGYGRFAFLPGGSLRILVHPGHLGVPKEARDLKLRHWRGIQHHEALGDVVDIRDEYTGSVVLRAAGLAAISKNQDPAPFFSVAAEQIDSIPRPHA